MENSKFPSCPPFTMLLSDYSQINSSESTVKFSRGNLAQNLNSAELGAKMPFFRKIQNCIKSERLIDLSQI